MATELWTWQGGTTFDDYIRAVVVGPNDSVVLAGDTWGAWGSTKSGERASAAVKLNADGTVLWRWQAGNESHDHITAASMGRDGSVALVGHGEDFTAIRLDRDGKLVSRWQGGTENDDVANAVAMSADGSSLVLAGYTYGSWGVTNHGMWDFAACRIDADGTLLWKWQDGTVMYDQLWAAAMGEDGSVVLAGESAGDWSGGNKGDFDFVAVKLDADGKELWRWQDGTPASEAIHAATMTPDGSVVLAGYTLGNWAWARREQRISGGLPDFAAVKLDADGKEVWRWQDGTDEYNAMSGAAAENDGSVVLAGSTRGTWSGSSAGEKDFAAVKLDVNGTEVWRWQGGSAGNDYLSDVAAASDGRIVMAGTTFGSLRDANLGRADFAAVMLDPKTIPAPVLKRTTSEGPPSKAMPMMGGLLLQAVGAAVIILGVLLRMTRNARKAQSQPRAPRPTGASSAGSSQAGYTA